MLTPLSKDVDIWTTEYLQQLPHGGTAKQVKEEIRSTVTLSPEDHITKSPSVFCSIYIITRTAVSSTMSWFLILLPLSSTSLNVRSQPVHPVLEYTKATGLQPILLALGGEDRYCSQHTLSLHITLLHHSLFLMSDFHLFSCVSWVALWLIFNPALWHRLKWPYCE